MECPFCRTALAGYEGFCSNCDLGLTVSAGAVTARLPEITPGRRLVTSSFALSPLPGRPRRDEDMRGVCTLQGLAEGVLATFHGAQTGAFTDFSQSFGDACVRAGFTPLDPGVRLGLSARHALLGAAQVYYSFNVSLLLRSLWIERYVQWTDQVASEPVSSPAVLPPRVQPGTTVTLELRAQGPTLRAYIDGQYVVGVHDPHFSQGSFGIRVGREPGIEGTARTLCHGYDIHGVQA